MRVFLLKVLQCCSGFWNINCCVSFDLGDAWNLYAVAVYSGGWQRVLLTHICKADPSLPAKTTIILIILLFALRQDLVTKACRNLIWPLGPCLIQPLQWQRLSSLLHLIFLLEALEIRKWKEILWASLLCEDFSYASSNCHAYRNLSCALNHWNCSQWLSLLVLWLHGKIPLEESFNQILLVCTLGDLVKNA